MGYKAVFKLEDPTAKTNCCYYEEPVIVWIGKVYFIDPYREVQKDEYQKGK